MKIDEMRAFVRECIEPAPYEYALVKDVWDAWELRQADTRVRTSEPSWQLYRALADEGFRVSHDIIQRHRIRAEYEHAGVQRHVRKRVCLGTVIDALAARGCRYDPYSNMWFMGDVGATLDDIISASGCPPSWWEDGGVEYLQSCPALCIDAWVARHNVRAAAGKWFWRDDALESYVSDTGYVFSSARDIGTFYDALRVRFPMMGTMSTTRNHARAVRLVGIDWDG